MVGLASRRMLAAGCVLAALTSSSAALAQTAEDKAAAETLFEDGKRLMHDKRFAEACPKLAESLHLDPGIGTMLWLADCYEKTGRIASAWAEFREAAESAAREHDNREKVARERAAKLESRLPRLTLVIPAASQVDGLEIKRDAEVVDKAVWGTEMPVDPGSHLLAASAPHKKPSPRQVKLQEGHT